MATPEHSYQFQVVDENNAPVDWTSIGGGTGTPGTPIAESPTTSAVALNGGVSVPCTSVFILNDSASGANLLIGNATAQVVPVAPGAGITVPTTDVNLIFRKSASGTITAYAWPMGVS